MQVRGEGEAKPLYAVAAARGRTRRTGRPLGAVISDLARRSLIGANDQQDGSAAEDSAGPFRPFPSRGQVVRNELIEVLRDQEGV